MWEIRVNPASRTPAWALLPAAAAWLGVVVLGRGMGSMPGTMGFGPVTFVAVWAVMTGAMMLPSVTPFAAVYARTFGDRPTERGLAFVSGYLVVWIATALPAYGIARVADALVTKHPAAATLLAVLTFASCGVYQLTPLKDRCLATCRSPLGFVVKYSALRGRTRDFRVGFLHGAYCIACCWALMTLLLAFGLMNLAAMAILASIIYAERTASWGPRLGRLVGVAALVLALGVVVWPGLAPALHQGPRTEMRGHM